MKIMTIFGNSYIFFIFRGYLHGLFIFLLRIFYNTQSLDYDLFDILVNLSKYQAEW